MRLLAAVCVALTLPAAASAGPSPRFDVVAAENVWGSIAAQLAGSRASVQSILVNPATDPHSYEPTPSDARTMAEAKIVVVNGIGYDDWASRLVAANGSGGRAVISVGDILGLSQGDNPHQWYSPPAVRKVVTAITAAYIRVDPADAGYFAARRRQFETKALARYDSLLAEIRRRFAGVPVGYSESIFAPLGASLGLRLLTPAGFAKAIAEGGDVSLQDQRTAERQLRDRVVKVWVLNSQNVTPEVDRLTSLARARRIPVVTVTETLAPATLDFEQWQAAELERLLAALHRATGR